MAISEEDRHELYLALEQVLGRKQATTMMEHLPPAGWADVATKHDLAALADKATLHREIAGVHREIGASVRTMVLTSVSAVVATGALAFAAAGLT